MNLAQIIRAVEAECDDQTFDRSRLIQLVNETILDIAQRVRLPDLIVQGNIIVNAGDREHQMVNNAFHHNLFECYNFTNQKWCSILYSMKDLFRVFRKADTRSFENQLETVDSYSKVTGDITHISVNGVKVDWLPIPERQNELQIKYYRFPYELTDDLHEPDYIPVNLQRPLIVSGVMLRGLVNYNGAVQEDRSLLVRYNKYERGFEIGLRQLSEFFPFAPYKYPELKRTRIWF